uniref:Uncharacterized protein n=1 Tax=Anguilla anguilla TaxID=7936 RepID=A0A0E9RUR7_ANGAN
MVAHFYISSQWLTSVLHSSCLAML